MEKDTSSHPVLDKRADLISGWFRERARETEEARAAAESLVWDGFKENKLLPAECCTEVGNIRLRASYLIELVQHAARTGKDKWEADPDKFRLVLAVATECESCMSKDLLLIQELYDLVVMLEDKSERRLNDVPS